MPRDMTKKQFDDACQRYGFKPRGFLGYYEIGHNYSVSIWNAPEQTRRGQLAYLLKMRDAIERKEEAAT